MATLTKKRPVGRPRKVEAKMAAPKKIAPLTSYDGYSIERVGKQVFFGCGAVKVNADLIRETAEALDNPVVSKAIKLVKALANSTDGYRSTSQILDISPAMLRRIAG